MDRPSSSCERVSLKRKFEEILRKEAEEHVNTLNSSLSSSELDRIKAKNAVYALLKLLLFAKDVSLICNGCDVVPGLLKHLKLPDPDLPKPLEHEVEDACIEVLQVLLNAKQEYKDLIVHYGALDYLRDLLKIRKEFVSSRAFASLVARGAFAIASLLDDPAKEDVIPTLVELLEYDDDAGVQKSAVLALHLLANANEDNLKQIVKCNALPSLVLLLAKGHGEVQYQAVSLLKGLATSFSFVERELVRAGVLRPLIRLLRSSHSGIQEQAALLIGALVDMDHAYEARIAQSGAIQPLIYMLKSSDIKLQQSSAFALALLAQDAHNQVGIALNGGIEPILNALFSHDMSTRDYAATALTCLANYEDNVVEIVKFGGVQKLIDGDFKEENFKVLVEQTVEKLKNKMREQRVWKQLLFFMRFGEEVVRRRVAFSLAHVCGADDQASIFVHNKGLEILLDSLSSSNYKQRRQAAMAFNSLASRILPLSDAAARPRFPDPLQCYGGQYVNNREHSDITFKVEGKQFYAHRAAFHGCSSDFFETLTFIGRPFEQNDVQPMLESWDVFELLMRFIYVGNVDFGVDIAPDLLEAAQKYMMRDLKWLCQQSMVQGLSTVNVKDWYDFSKTQEATFLKQGCILFCLQHFSELNAEPWYDTIVGNDLCEMLTSLLA